MTRSIHAAALAAMLSGSVPDCSSNVVIGTVPPSSGTPASSCGTPVARASGLDGGGALIYQNGTLFWGVEKPAIVSMPFAGGTPTVLTTETGVGGFGLAFGMQVAGGYLYFGANTYVKRMPVGGGASTTLAQDPTGTIISTALDAESIYWSTLAGISKVPLAGGTATLLATNHGAMEIALDDTNVYWSNTDTGDILSVPKAGGTPVVLASRQANPMYLVAGGDSVYWVESEKAPLCANGLPTPGAGPTTLEVTDPDVCAGGDDPAYVMKVSKSGGAVTMVASAQIDPRGLAVDATYVYWLTSQWDTTQPTGRRGTVARAPLAGGPAEIVAIFAAYSPNGPTPCPGGICWTDSAQGASSGSVWQLDVTCGSGGLGDASGTGGFGVNGLGGVGGVGGSG